MFKWSAEGALNEGRTWVDTMHLVVTILAQGEEGEEEEGLVC